MGKASDQVLAKMRDLAAAGHWVGVPADSPTIRLTRTMPTPAWARGGTGHPVAWPDDTYAEHLFITLAGTKVVMKHAPSPWVRRADTTEPYWYVDLLLASADPWDVLARRCEIKAARQAARHAT